MSKAKSIETLAGSNRELAEELAERFAIAKSAGFDPDDLDYTFDDNSVFCLREKCGYARAEQVAP